MKSGLPEVSRREGAPQAKLLLVVLSFAWGLAWPAMKIALGEVSPWSFRLVGYVVGTGLMFALVRLKGRSAVLPAGPARLHVIASAFLTVLGFGLFSTFAQLTGMTSRVVIVAYSMPVWASLMGWLVLGERLNVVTILALVMCIGGLGVLIYPAAASGTALGLLLALASALSWAAGTIYLKWARIKGDVIAVTAWQLLVSLIVIVACLPVFEGVPHLWPLSPLALACLAYQGLIGTGLAYFMWFDVVGRLPAATASLGTLLVPVVGIVSAVLVLGDRPTAADAVGFALIFAAAACVLVQPSGSK